MRQKLAPFLLGLSLAAAYILGSATSQLSHPVAQAQIGRPRWEYMCTEGRNRETVLERASTAGRDGWEMVTYAAEVGGLWCFKRPMSATVR